MQEDLNQLVAEANGGSKAALETIVGYAQGYVYNLALRMLQLPMDAEDATQEIMIKLITNLNQFRGESQFSTWMYRVASNHLLNMRMREKEKNSSFEDLSTRLETSLARYEATTEQVVEKAELIEEVRRSCTMGMLMCLNREDRLALVLGELLEVSSEEGAYIMNISSSAYRKRLSRARTAIVAFVSGKCGLVNPESACRCNKHVRNKIQAGLMDPNRLQYSQPHDPVSSVEAERAQRADLDNVYRATALLRAHPAYSSRVDFVEVVKQILNADNSGSM